jgi:protein TonB
VPVSAEPKPIPIRPPATAIARSLNTEPVPEPAPDVALNSFSAEIEAIIPNPDTPPPSLELGPPSGGVAAQQADVPPTLVESVSPVYPVAARSLRAEGQVKVRLSVLPDGRVSAATVFECSRRGVGFEAAALNAVKRWRYEPAPLQSGSRSVTVTIHFQQPEGRP